MAKKEEKRSISKAHSLGDVVLTAYRFENLSEVFQPFQTKEYSRLNHKQKSEKVNRALLDLILSAPKGQFLLMAVIEFIDFVAKENVLENYSLSSFELWLNQFSELNEEENYLVRGKIVGKWIPRDEYQIIFPVGMGKVHPGSHYVTAHASPDLDTTIASFWGWVDAFGARVSEGVHIWNVPGGAPSSSIEVALLFHHIFGQNVFEHLAKTRNKLALSSLELMTQRGVVKQKTDQSSLAVDHERTQKAIILVDDNGYFMGDWRSFDVEGVRQVIMLFNNCLRWFENNLHISSVSLFGRKDLSAKDLPVFVGEMFGIKISDCPPTKDFVERQKRYLEGYLRKVLKVKNGLSSTFSEFADAMKDLGLEDFVECRDHLNALADSELFENGGKLIEDRPKIFKHLEEIVISMDEAIQSVAAYTERLDVALKIKTDVFGFLPQVVSYRADVEELRSKIGNYPHLTVTSTDLEGKMIPLGVVRQRDLQQAILGTVTLRDFCNREETKIPSYFEVISVIDHHKTALNTSSAPVVYISDAQSSNAVVAELAFAINDKYSTGGMSLSEIQEEMDEVQKDFHDPKNKRLMKRLLNRFSAASALEKNPEGSFIDPLREFVEYMHFLYAILDDTDLLSKVSKRDVEVVAELINRLKSLKMGKELELISFDDLEPGPTFAQMAASRILQNPEMYSLYRKIYLAKEQLVEENFALCAQGKESSIFVDTKIQNGCARIGQTKIFANNYHSFEKTASKMREVWVAASEDLFSDRREVDLYMQMISTIAGAEDVYCGEGEDHKHKDELWLWIPMTEQAIEHLKGFLNAFKESPKIIGAKEELEVQVQGDFAEELAKIFKESFLPVSIKIEKSKHPSLSILRYPAGMINSRKAMISPYLPKLLS